MLKDLTNFLWTLKETILDIQYMCKYMPYMSVEQDHNLKVILLTLLKSYGGFGN